MKPKEKALLSAILEVLEDFEADIYLLPGSVQIYMDSFARHIILPDLDTETLQQFID